MGDKPEVEIVKTVEKKPKRTRAPSAYNIFMGAKMREGMTFRQAVDAWNARK
jgi:hypothetical protein